MFTRTFAVLGGQLKIRGIAADPLGATSAPWMIAVVGGVVATVVAITYLVQTIRTRKLSVPALIFIGTTAMFWQEFYADWGAFLYYNSSFTQLPWWGKSWHTTPNKPLFVIFGYGWFYSGSFPALMALVRRFRDRHPNWSLGLACTVLVGPLFFAWNLITADGAAYFGHWWNYVRTVGPAVHTSQGSLAFLYPALPFAGYAIVTVYVLSKVDASGQRWFERVARVPNEGVGWRYEMHRAAAWMVGMNALYAFAFVIPLMLFRTIVLGHSALVP